MCISNKCSFYINNLEKSELFGFYFNENVYFEMIDKEERITNIPYNIPLGCDTKETNLFKTQLTDGILGLSKNDKSFVSILYKINIIQNNIFSLCFSHEIESESSYFSIGKIFTTHHLSKNIKYVDLVNGIKKDAYCFKLDYIKIGKKKINYNGLAYIELGASKTYFPERIF